MKKSLPLIKTLVIIAILAPVLFLGHRYISNNETVYPYPYGPVEILQDEVSEAEKADIIIIGDSAGAYLMEYMPDFIEKTSELLRKPLTVYNWSRQGEGLAHMLAKVKSLKKMPFLLIYHGGLDELQRKRFNLKSLPTFYKNISLAKNESILTSIYAAPILSRFIYWPLEKANINTSSTGFPSGLSSTYAVKTLEALYTLYQWEAQELSNYLKLKDATFWFIPQAYNLTERPIRVCDATENTKIEKALDQANIFIKEGKTKDALKIIKAVLIENNTHALALHTMGNLLMSQGQYQQAKRAYFQSMIYDCGLTRSNPLMLKILMEQIEKRDFTIIDFNRMVTSNIGRNILFEGPRKPQSIYYELLFNEMIENFEKLMKR